MQRPTSVTVFGILNLIFSVLGLCGVGFGILGLVVLQNPDVGGAGPTPLPIQLMQDNPAYRVFSFVSVGLGVFSSFLLAAAGIGLLKLRPWGRTLSIIYGGYSILMVLATVAVNFALYAPELEKAQQQAIPQATGEAIGGMVGAGVGGCVGLIYPLTLLGFMLFNQNLRRAFGADTRQSDVMHIPEDPSHPDQLS